MASPEYLSEVYAMSVKIKVVRTLTKKRDIYTLRYINMYTGKPLSAVYCRWWKDVMYWINTWDKQYEGLM